MNLSQLDEPIIDPGKIVIPLEGGGTVSVYVDSDYDVWILVPSNPVITENDMALCKVRLSAGSSTILGFVDELRCLWTYFYTSEGRGKTFNAFKARESVTVRTLTPDGPLVLHIVEADGDVVIKLRDDVKDYGKGLLRLQSLAVWYATRVWRRDLQTIRDSVRFGARLYRLSLAAAGLTIICSPLAWEANKILAAILFLASLSSIYFSRSLNRFNIQLTM
jgi:hypothetical protein